MSLLWVGLFDLKGSFSGCVLMYLCVFPIWVFLLVVFFSCLFFFLCVVRFGYFFVGMIGFWFHGVLWCFGVFVRCLCFFGCVFV